MEATLKSWKKRRILPLGEWEAALSLAKSLSREEATRLGLLLIQLGTTLDTIVALEELDEDGEAVDTGR